MSTASRAAHSIRAIFLAVMLTAVAVGQTPKALPVATSIDHLVDPVLRWQDAPLADDKNAAPLIRELVELCKQPDSVSDFWRLPYQVRDERRAWRAGEELDLLKAYLERHRPKYQLVEQAVARDQWHSNDPKVITAVPSDFLALRKYLHLKVEWLASTGDLAGAGRQAEQNLRFYYLPRVAEAGMVRMWLADSLYHLAGQAAIHGDRLELISPSLTWVEQLPAAELDPAAELRVVFLLHFLVGLEKYPSGTDAEAALAAWLRTRSTNQADINEQFGRRIEFVRALLKEHPGAWDKDATIKLGNDIFIEAIRNPRPARDQVTLLEKTRRESAAWPEEISLQTMASLPLFMKNPQEEVDENTLAQARAKLAGVPNAIGKHLASDCDPYRMLAASQRTELSLQGYKTVLAVRLFRAQHHRLPKTLEELVEAKLLKSVPRDPYGDRLRYSPEKQLVWSVGPDGRDDGGTPSKGNGGLKFLNQFLPKSEKKPEPEVADEATFDFVFEIDRKPEPARPTPAK